ncbi:uncharacterized protein F5Z01DRAFT_102393 [Emericellopsis atlantica]|uniref:NAD-dependent epimerase/dehydratase domain-containing protein n=1 Tax=Emericellopsis atlantica TaxID=2614577 RepID=A0A9P7ZLU5_9HYPO|nr:uncharacterized protein F5Z01DRAFT_102393 [Emericellopsis atlantica]KAG9254321.1 hypothetical protein F5Z01DRAFT_102393 [Emericellopsis atlantica]
MPHILITGAGGFLGQDLAVALLKADPSLDLTLTDIHEPSKPPSSSTVTSLALNLTDASAVAKLLEPSYDAVYLLHGLMSGGAEANLELGWTVNFDSHRIILDTLRKSHPGTKVIFPSSLAVYGPQQQTTLVSETTVPQPQSSYGAQKLMIETYLNDFSRRGLLDGRVVRLPTIIVRPGAPSAAASSFCSAIIREPVAGVPTTLPVPKSLALWVCSPTTVIENLIRIKDVPSSKFGIWRTVNLPGITVTVQEMLDALRDIRGEDALKLIKDEHDAKIEGIVGSWPARSETSRADGLGMKADSGLIENIKTFVARYGQ